jgi:hypothetical protein
MDIFSVILGENLKTVDSAHTFTDEEEAKRAAEDLQEDNQQAIMVKSNIQIANQCDHEDWKIVQLSDDSDLTMRCNECRTWRFIEFNNNSATVKTINLDDTECNNCGGKLQPINKKINQCADCEGYTNNQGKYIDPEVVDDILSLEEKIDI